MTMISIMNISLGSTSYHHILIFYYFFEPVRIQLQLGRRQCAKRANRRSMGSANYTKLMESQNCDIKL